MADTPAPVKGKKPGGRAPEPAKPTAPPLPPPRLVKSAKLVVDPAAASLAAESAVRGAKA